MRTRIVFEPGVITFFRQLQSYCTCSCVIFEACGSLRSYWLYIHWCWHAIPAWTETLVLMNRFPLLHRLLCPISILRTAMNRIIVLRFAFVPAVLPLFNSLLPRLLYRCMYRTIPGCWFRISKEHCLPAHMLSGNHPG